MNARNRVFMILGLLTLGSLIWYLVTARTSGDLKLIGTVDANEVLVSAKIPGRIQTLNVHEGQAVKAGELIAVIESEDLAGSTQGSRGDSCKSAIEAQRDRGDRAADARRNEQRDDQCRGPGACGAGGACQAQATAGPSAGGHHAHCGAGQAGNHERSGSATKRSPACRQPRPRCKLRRKMSRLLRHRCKQAQAHELLAKCQRADGGVDSRALWQNAKRARRSGWS